MRSPAAEPACSCPGWPLPNREPPGETHTGPHPTVEAVIVDARVPCQCDPHFGQTNVLTKPPQ